MLTEEKNHPMCRWRSHVTAVVNRRGESDGRTTSGEEFRMKMVSKLKILGLTTSFVAMVLATTSADVVAQDEKPYVIQDGKVDWYTYSGFRRYHAECHVCHGPDGLGSSFAPNLVDSLKSLSYDDYANVVVNGRVNVSNTSNSNMPSFGSNRNVMCFIDDIYAYLKARADGALGRGRPENEPKPAEAKERDDSCFGD
jgi:methanol metabolism-related c-type cytochrome